MRLSATPPAPGARRLAPSRRSHTLPLCESKRGLGGLQRGIGGLQRGFGGLQRGRGGLLEGRPQGGRRRPKKSTFRNCPESPPWHPPGLGEPWGALGGCSRPSGGPWGAPWALWGPKGPRGGYGGCPGRGEPPGRSPARADPHLSLCESQESPWPPFGPLWALRRLHVGPRCASLVLFWFGRRRVLVL